MELKSDRISASPSAEVPNPLNAAAKIVITECNDNQIRYDQLEDLFLNNPDEAKWYEYTPTTKKLISNDNDYPLCLTKPPKGVDILNTHPTFCGSGVYDPIAQSW